MKGGRPGPPIAQGVKNETHFGQQLAADPKCVSVLGPHVIPRDPTLP